MSLNCICNRSCTQATLGCAGGNQSKHFFFDTTFSGRLEAEVVGDSQFNMTLPAAPPTTEAVPQGLGNSVCKVPATLSLAYCTFGLAQ